MTFETEKVHSRATEEYGWRITPYAYLLLKPRGPQVDKLPPLRIDLDFLDTSGFAVLPVESPAVPLDARQEKGPPRPATKVQITQTLDERQAGAGKLLLEIKATANGLVPELEQIVEVAPAGFTVVKAEDQGVSVVRFEEESDAITISSERICLLTLQASADRTLAPETFAFPRERALTRRWFTSASTTPTWCWWIRRSRWSNSTAGVASRRGGSPAERPGWGRWCWRRSRFSCCEGRRCAARRDGRCRNT